MIKQGLILLAVAAVCSALGDGTGYNSKKNTFQAPSQYTSVAAFHSTKTAQSGPTQSQIQSQVQPQVERQVQPQTQPQRVPFPYYTFGYDAEGSSRQESADASGKVTGSYKVINEDGSMRLVKYVADENGFRADIDTNEPGTKSDNPADVTLKSAAVEKKYEAPAKYAAPSYSQKPTKQEQSPSQYTSVAAFHSTKTAQSGPTQSQIQPQVQPQVQGQVQIRTKRQVHCFPWFCRK